MNENKREIKYLAMDCNCNIIEITKEERKYWNFHCLPIGWILLN